MPEQPKTRQGKKEAVAPNEYYEYVPGSRTFQRHQPWCSLKVDVFEYPKNLEDTLAPAIQDHAFSIPLQGHREKAHCRIEGKHVFVGEMLPGQVVVLPRLNSMSWQWSTPKSCTESPKSAAMYLPEKILETTALETFGMDGNRIELLPSICQHNDGLIRQIVLELIKDTRQDNPVHRLYIESLTQLFTVHVLRNYCTEPIKLNQYKDGLANSTLQLVTDYVNAHLHEEISLQCLAQLAGLSTYYFVRLFKQSVGLAPHQYVIRRRLEKARQLLKTSHLSILQIAIDVGFSSSSHFSHTFKKAFGVSPSQYRQ